ncbi:SDR family oxidoreductase [Ancylobacter mangrovi]|uniref:SDR family oxidoreductase n=1 Tax=Ancylobacter mangrovi TaxID=2972472 RepID=UPI00216161E2|nr:SDR family oxidoreductase [Ancylobacter mangrovi]MCS0504853.1 SDR family oxidoreductase [Ancylobacter mangrovi]
MTKTVLITGCSTGFGRAASLHLAQQGWNVVATMRRPEVGADLAADNVLVTRLDVQDPDSIAAALDAGIARFGRIDVVVNNAGYGLFGLFEATPREKVIEQFEVNLFGVMDVIRAVLPHMRANGGGVIVNVSSGAGVFTLPMISLYCASKFALEGFSESLSFELASQNIRVKLVEPGGVLSTDFGRRSTQEAAGAASIPDYDRFVGRTAALFAGLRGERLASEADVVEVIYRAASDDSDRLRYVATEDIRPLVAARREGSEEAYMALLRERFSGAA